ncbi:MAG: T9SS type A sorting domain-containing protein, partial [Candidatus Kapabacteria bacterium]|nr:T9SS type A sorting domain-containing protein [Candidatus Kapabacteria bacterium]
ATEVTLFDMSGRKVATLLSVSKAGVHTVRIDAVNLPSGMYTVSMTTSKETITRQIQVVK